MRAGRLRHWMTFELGEDETDSDGAHVEAWIPAFGLNHRMPCEVTHLSGRELIAAQAEHSKVTARLVTRYRPGFEVAAGMGRLRAVAPNGVTYNVEAIIPDPDSQQRYVTLLVSTGVNVG